MTRQLLHGLFVESPFSLGDVTCSGPVDFTLLDGGGRAIGHDQPEGQLIQKTLYDGAPLYSTVERTDGSYLLRLHGAVDFTLTKDLTRVEAYVDPACPRELVELLATGNLLATRAMLQGELVLHASAVARGGRTLAFVAPSGVGKSTMSALCCLHAGSSFVTDDVLRLDLGGGDVRAWRGLHEARLRRDLADLAAGHPQTSRQTVDGRTAWRPDRSMLPQTTLAAIVLPQPDRDRTELELKRLTGGRAVLAIAAAPRILDWTRGLELALALAATSRLVERVPVYRALIPWGPPFRPDVARQLMDLV